MEEGGAKRGAQVTDGVAMRWLPWPWKLAEPSAAIRATGPGSGNHSRIAARSVHSSTEMMHLLVS